jgi:hypothetical protein
MDTQIVEHAVPTMIMAMGSVANFGDSAICAPIRLPTKAIMDAADITKA